MGRMKRTLLLALFMSCIGTAQALDASDIALLVKNGVHESVIINMVRGNKMRAPLTTSEVLLLNTSGASPALLEFLTRPEASAVSSPPAVVSESVYSTPPQVVVTAPAPTVVTTPTYVSPTYYVGSPYVYGYDYYRYGRPYSYGYSYGRGWGGWGGGWGGWGGGSRHYRRPPPPGGGHRPPGGSRPPGHRPPGGRRP